MLNYLQVVLCLFAGVAALGCFVLWGLSFSTRSIWQRHRASVDVIQEASQQMRAKQEALMQQFFDSLERHNQLIEEQNRILGDIAERIETLSPP